MIAPPPIHLVLLDDHAVVRAGYRRLLELEPGFKVVAEFDDGDLLMAAASAAPLLADVVLLDLSLRQRSGLDVLRRLRERVPQWRWLVCSMHDSPLMVRQALEAGAQGFITKAADPGCVAEGVRAVLRGETYLSPDLRHSVAVDTRWRLRAHELTQRELEVLHELLQGHSVERIAQRLFLSPKTVANHQTAIRNKLGAANAVELVHRASELGLWSGPRSETGPGG